MLLRWDLRNITLAVPTQLSEGCCCGSQAGSPHTHTDDVDVAVNCCATRAKRAIDAPIVECSVGGASGHDDDDSCRKVSPTVLGSDAHTNIPTILMPQPNAARAGLNVLSVTRLPSSGPVLMALVVMMRPTQLCRKALATVCGPNVHTSSPTILTR